MRETYMTVAEARAGVALALALAISGAAVVACGASDAGGDVDGGADALAFTGPATSPNGLPLGDADGGLAGPAPTTETYVPFLSEFAGFTSWPKFDLVSSAPIGDGVIHGASKRTVYINKMPEPGSKSFPVHTVIVKQMETGETLARVKRGGEYNKNGAVGWEWFELQQVNGQWAIGWRGITPPAGYCYGGIVGGACNDCHRAFAGNDYVATSALDLSKL